MNYRSLLVQLDADKACAERVGFAIRLAHAHDCHLVGVAATGEIRLPSESEASEPHAELEALVRNAMRERAASAVEAFRHACETARFRFFEVVMDELDKAASIVERAHCSDLVILTQERATPVPAPGRQGLVEQVVMDSARPTLLLPDAGHFDATGGTALVAWDDSREAARAVLDALPLLRKCERVEVVAWKERFGLPGQASLPGRLQALRQWMAWHGVDAEVRVEKTDIPIAEALLSRAADLECRLVVMGAYGHTRQSERVLGGATRGLLRSMTLPVLMSH